MSGIRMNEYDQNQKQIRAYLLGGLNDHEREVIEERVFTDPAFFDDVRMVEEELMEDYVFEVLPPGDAEKFARRLLVSPEQVQRLETTATLKKYADRQATLHPAFFRLRPWGLAIAATLIVAAVVGIWLRRTTSLERTVVALNVSRQTSDTQGDFTIELPALRFRSEDDAPPPPEPQVIIPKQSDVVQIRLPIEASSYRTYQTTLVREPDSILFTLNDRSPVPSGNRQLLVIRVPADALVPGGYQLVVKGKTESGREDNLGAYVFTVLQPSAD